MYIVVDTGYLYDTVMKVNMNTEIRAYIKGWSLLTVSVKTIKAELDCL